MHNQYKQYVILTIVLLACGASIFFGVRNIVRSTDEVTTFAVGDWEGITLPRYYGPTVYTTSQRSMATVTLPMTSTSSRSLFHHSVAPSYRAAVATTQQVHTSNATYRVYQTSDQVTRYVGAGNSSSGSASFGATNVQQSTTSASFSMPTLELITLGVRTHTLANNNINTLTASTPVLADAGTLNTNVKANRLRRIIIEGGVKYGQYNGEYDPEEEKIWDGDEEEGEWVDPPAIGTEREIKGELCVWTGRGWIPKSDIPDPDAPIGDIPWLMILFAAAAFGICKGVKKKENING